MQLVISENRERIAEICRTHHVCRLSAFGSAVRDDFNPQSSDVDLLVEFEPLSEMEYAPNYFSLMRAFDRLFGRKVDVVTDSAVRNFYLRQVIEAKKVALYAA